MWVKDRVEYRDGGLLLNGKRYWQPTPEQFVTAGYEWVEPTPPPKRYSKLKVIRALGERWGEYKAGLEANGLIDEFMAAQFLAGDDPAFAAVYANLTDAEKEVLDTECLYDD